MVNNVIPTCRYHNIQLVRQGHQREDGRVFTLYCALGVRVYTMPPEGQEPAHSSQLIDMNRGYTFGVYKCPDCSYLELHDDPV